MKTSDYNKLLAEIDELSADVELFLCQPWPIEETWEWTPTEEQSWDERYASVLREIDDIRYDL